MSVIVSPYGESGVPLSEQLSWLHHSPQSLVLSCVHAALLTLQTWNVCGRTFSCIPACNLIDVCLVICLRLNYSLWLLKKCFVCFWWVSILHNISPSLFHLLWRIHLFSLQSYYWELREASVGRRGETHWSLREALYSDYLVKGNAITFDLTWVHTITNGSS